MQIFFYQESEERNKKEIKSKMKKKIHKVYYIFQKKNRTQMETFK